MESPPTRPSELTDLRDLTHEELRAFIAELGVERYRADQIFRWVHGRAVDSVEEMTDLGKALRARLGEQAEVRRLAEPLRKSDYGRYLLDVVLARETWAIGEVGHVADMP